MSWLRWLVQIFLMFVFISVVVGVGWEQITNSKYQKFIRGERQEIRLKREFEDKSNKANNLEGYRIQASKLSEKLISKRELMLHFSNPANIENWCVQLSETSDTNIGCELVRRKDSEFYYEQQVDLTVILKEEKLNSLLAALTGDQATNLDTVFWRNILVSRNKQVGNLDFKASLSFIYWREESDL